jgi:hypothetical protein
MILEMGRADLMGPCLCLGEHGSGDRRLRDLGLRLAALAAGLVAGAGILPTVAQAAVPSVATRSADVTGSETAVVQGDAEPRGPQTTVYIAYGLATGTWCASQGQQGTAMQTSPVVLGSGETIYEVSITVGGQGARTGRVLSADALIAVKLGRPVPAKIGLRRRRPKSLEDPSPSDA